MSTLVVAATHAEAAHVPAGTPVLVCGIGKVAAATAVAARLASDRSCTRVVNIGTAGALRPGIEGLFVPGRVLNHDLSSELLRQLGYDPREWLDLQGDPAVCLATGDTFVSDPTVRDRLALEATLVDMEGYAIAWACLQAGVAVQLVKHVSDNADETAMSWPELVDRSARALGDWLRVHTG